MKNTSIRWLYVLALSLGLVFISTKTIYAEGVESSGEEILQEISEDQEPVNLTDTEPAVTENTGNVISESDEPAVPAEPSGPAATETTPVPENTVTDEQVIISDAPAASGIAAETPKGTDPEVLPVQESLNKDSVIINEMDTVSEKNDADAEVGPASVSDNTASSPAETKSTTADDNHTSQSSQSDAPAEPLITDLPAVQESVSDLKSVSPLAIKSAQSFVQASSETSLENNTEAENEESLDSDSEKEAVKYYVGYFDEEDNVYRTVEEITEPEGLGKIEETQVLFWKYYTLDLASPYLAILHEDGFVLPEGYVLVSRKALGGVDWVGEDGNTYDSILKSFRVSDVSEIPDYFVLPETYWAYIISFEGTDDNPEDIYKTHGVDIELPVVSDQKGEETVWTVSLNYNNDDSSPVVEDRTTNVSISYEFSGWTDGETTYSRGEPFADNRPATLTAVFDEVASADAITLPVIHRDNYAFLGWYLFPSFEEEYKISGSSFVPTYDKQMIYARWEIIGAAYNLWVGGTQVTENNQGDVLSDGKVSYDPESNTLSLAEARIYGYHTGEAEETNTAYAIYYEGDAPEEGKPLPVFTIHVSGDSYIVNEEQEPGISRLIGIGVHNAALRVEGNDENAALFITTGNADEGSIGILAKDLTLSNIELDTTAGNVSKEALGSYGVRADSIKLVGDTAFLASGYDGSFLSEGGLDLAGLSYRPRAWVNDEPAISMETRWDGETDLSTYKFIFITELVPYDFDLWVNGIRVTSENKDNVLNDEGVSVLYDEDRNALVLNNAEIRITRTDTSDGNIIYGGIVSTMYDALNIDLAGNNTISSQLLYFDLFKSPDVAGISSNGSIYIQPLERESTEENTLSIDISYLNWHILQKINQTVGILVRNGQLTVSGNAKVSIRTNGWNSDNIGVYVNCEPIEGEEPKSILLLNEYCELLIDSQDKGMHISGGNLFVGDYAHMTIKANRQAIEAGEGVIAEGLDNQLVLVNTEPTEEGSTYRYNDFELDDSYKYIRVLDIGQAFEIWVAGTQITTLNKDNVLNDESHSVSYVYDADTNTWSLVLNGAVISAADVSAHTGSEEHVYAGIYSKKPLSIVLNGENTITGEPQSDSGSSAIYGIFVDEEYGDLDFNQGDDHNGSLRILLKGAENDTLTGIRNKGNTIFRGVNTVIQFDSTGKPASVTGIEDMNSIGMINHSNISITADDAKEFCGLRGGDIDIDDSALSIVVEKADKAYGMHQTTDTGIRLIGKADVKIDVSGANEGYGVYTTHEFLTFDDSVFEAAAPTAAINSPTINDKNNRGAIVKVNLTDQETIFPGPEYNLLSDQYRYVYLPAYMQYDVWVEGTRVTDKNKEDVLEDGTVSFEYDAAKKSGTLILDDASIHLHKLPTVAVGTDASISAGIYSKMDLDIQVNSNSSITNEGSDEEILAGIYIVSDTAAGESYISIKPSEATNTVPVLSISTENSGAETKTKKNLGVYSNKHVFVNGVKVDITSGGAMHPSINPEVDPDCFYYPASAGIYLEDSLTLNEDAEVIARGGNAGHSAGVYLSNGSLFLNYNSSLEGIGGNAVVRSEGVNTTFNGDTHVTGTAVLKAKGGTVSTLETDISDSPYSRGLVTHSLTTNENATVYAESSKAQSNGPVHTDESTGMLIDLFLSTNDESKVFVNVPESSECGNGIIVYEVDYYSVGIYVNDNSELHVDVDVSDRTYAVNSTLKVTGNAKVDILNRGARVDAVGLAGNLLCSDQSKTDRSLAEESAGNQQMTITVWSKGNPSNVEGISHSIEVMKGLNLTLNIASGTVKTHGISGNIKNNGAVVTLNIGLDNQSDSIICVEGTITESNNGSLTIQTGNASGDIIANLITKNTASRFESGSVLTVNTGDAGKNNVGLWFQKNNGKLYVQDSSLTINLGCAGGETGESVGIKGVSTFDISGSTIHIKTGNAPALSSGIYNDSEKTPLTMSAADSDIQVASGNAAQTVGIRGTVDLDGTAKLNVFSGNGTNSYGIQGNGGSAEGNSIVNVQSGDADEQSIGLKVELPNEYKWIIDNSASLNVTSGSGKQSFGVQGILYIPETSENVLIHTTGGKAVEWSSGVFGMINAAGICEIHTTGGEAKESFGISSSDTIICDEEYGSGVPKNVVIYATGSDAGKTSIGASGGILISGNTTVYLKSGRADESIGFTGDDNIEVRDDARLFVESGYGKTRSVGVQTSKLAISGNGYVDISAGDSGHESYGAENTGLQMSDSAIMVVKAGNAPDISIGFQGWQNAAGVLNVGTVSGNAALTVNAGDAAESIGVKGNLTIDGGKNGTPVVFINSGISPKGYGLNGKLSVPNNADVHIYGASKAIQHADNEKPDLNGKGAWVGDEFVPWNYDAAALGNYEYINVFPDQEPYEIVSAPGTWEKGSTGTADYHVENKLDDTKTYSEFVSVYIDDQLISAENYTTAPGSIWVKFLPSFMNGLSEGSHKVTAVFRNGYVSKNVQVKQKSSPSPSPAPKGNVSNGNSGSSGIVVTCQMAGYPANYAWNEAAKACQPGFIDANGVFRSTASIRQNVVPNTADQRTYLLTFVLSLISTLICSILLHEKH